MGYIVLNSLTPTPPPGMSELKSRTHNYSTYSDLRGIIIPFWPQGFVETNILYIFGRGAALLQDELMLE